MLSIFKKIVLLSHAVLHMPKSLCVGKKEAQLEVVESRTSPVYSTKAGWRIANGVELVAFAKEYSPGFMFEPHATDSQNGCVPTKTLKIRGGKVVEALINPFVGFPPRTLVLWVNDSVQSDT